VDSVKTGTIAEKNSRVAEDEIVNTNPICYPAFLFRIFFLVQYIIGRGI
jgi:hypothetical protein